MIEPRMATMLGVPDDRRAAWIPAVLAARAAPRRGRDVQRDHRRRRVLDERLRVPARVGQSGVDDHARRRPGAARGDCAPSPAISRARSCAAARARPSSSPCSVTGAALARRRVARGADDREFAAREDGDSRRRSELGPPRRRRRPIGRRVRARSRVGRRSATCRCSSPACRSTSARTTRRRVLQRAGDHGDRRSRHRRRARRDDVDVRLQRRVRAHQRGVPDMSKTTGVVSINVAGRKRRPAPLRTKDFLSVLDLRPRRARARPRPGGDAEARARRRRDRRRSRSPASTSRCCSKSRRSGRGRRS